MAKQAALWPVIIGGMLGGVLMLKIGINRALWLFGFVQIISILGFAVLARIGEGLWLLGLVIGFEYLGVGLGTAAFVAFIARTTNAAFAAINWPCSLRSPPYRGLLPAPPRELSSTPLVGSLSFICAH